MGTRYILFNATDGRRIVNLPAKDGDWSNDLDTPDTVECSLGLNNPIVAKLDLQNVASAGKTGIAAIDTGLDGKGAYVLASGVLWATSYDKRAETFQLTGSGPASLLGHRSILPVGALTADVRTWTIPDPTDNTKQIPNPALTTSYAGISLGSIDKRLVEQAMAWPGGLLPINLPPEEVDTDVEHERNYLGVDFKPVKEALDQNSQVIGGPEYAFVGKLNATRTALSWDMRVGTVADPLLHRDRVVRWNVTASQSPVSDLSVDFDASNMGSLSWATAGRQDDGVIVSRAFDSSLIDQGYPLMEVIDSSHTTVSIQATLDGYAAGNLLVSKTPTETWSFKVRAHPVDEKGRLAGPQLGDYGVGDFCQLAFSAFDEETGRGDRFFRQKRLVPLRIIGISGSLGSEFVTVKCAPVVG